MKISGTNNEDKGLGGEIGRVAGVNISRIEPATRIYLIVEEAGETYMGTLLIDDSAFCRQLYAILQDCLGKPTTEVGDIDLSHLL